MKLLAKRCGAFATLAGILGLFFSATRLAADETPKSPSSAKLGKDLVPQAVRQEIVHYRAARTKPKQQAAALKQLASLGDAGLAAAKDLLDKEVQQAETVIRASKKPTKLDESVTKLRKTLADLRHDPDLSKEKLHDIGVPAFEELSILYFQRAKALAAQAAKNARVVESLRQLVAVLQQCRAQWSPDAPLPVNEYLPKAESRLNELSSPEEEQAREILARNQARAAQFPADLRSGMDGLNLARMIVGLRPLLYDIKLCEAAQGHSKDMESRDFFSHESPVDGKKTPWDRARLAGTTASGENIYKGSSISTEALKAWFVSPGHHKNMFSESSTRQGLGHAGKLWTQMVGSGKLDGKTKQ
jgi:uncharacterized protein YkwD